MGAAMDRLKAMRLFRAVQETGSFALAAEREGISAPALSRQIANLESHLGARLFNRTTRRLSLTETGLHYLSRTEVILDAIDEAEAEAGRQHINPHGLLRISAPLSYTIAELGPVLASFSERYPDLSLDIDMSDRTVDIVHEGVDVALRISAMPAPNLIARKLADIHMVICAAPKYLADKGEPEAPEDLNAHTLLMYSYFNQGYTFQFRRDEQQLSMSLTGGITANNGDILRELAIAGRGLTIQPDFVVRDAIERGELCPVLQQWQMERFGVFAVYASRQHLPAKIRVFIDHLVQHLS